jgi:hypothetical protein
MAAVILIVYTVSKVDRRVYANVLGWRLGTLRSVVHVDESIVKDAGDPPKEKHLPASRISTHHQVKTVIRVFH